MATAAPPLSRAPHTAPLTYDTLGNPDRTTDALGRISDQDYDPLGRLVRTVQDVGGVEA
ncbi:hypothetical protein D9T17_02435 [Lysobacter enzymogenes]|uniref:RHS repeat protein n=1 Tax=Lysobacter enzymogenes TaxID=69 RepID=A0A3N2RND7_LYSEN|nr:hypothetical protein D9T17_02435 [Lysobacter enzymogenes]